MTAAVKRKIFIIAGEVSGDVLGGELMRAAPKGFKFAGVGGDCMKKAGLKTLFPISDLSVMGFAEVVMKSATLISRIKQTADAITKERPDIVLTIDSPSFAARVIKRVKKSAGRRPKFYHIVAPMVWAWGGSGRAKKYAKVFDKLFCFFDFEKPYFAKYGLETIVIGHPLYDVAHGWMTRNAKKRFITLIPGSRMGEVSKVMPVYREFAAANPKWEFAIPTTETTRDFILREIKSWPKAPRIVPFDDRYRLYNETKLAVAVIGTATAELAMMQVPAIVVWRPKWLTEKVSKFLLKIKYLGLVNIIARKGIYPELIGRDFTAENVQRAAESTNWKKVSSELKKADKLWHKKSLPMQMVIDSIRNS